jgi:hypothetical protein
MGQMTEPRRSDPYEIDGFIARSSLGTEGARLLRDRTTPEIASSIYLRAFGRDLPIVDISRILDRVHAQGPEQIIGVVRDLARDLILSLADTSRRERRRPGRRAMERHSRVFTHELDNLAQLDRNDPPDFINTVVAEASRLVMALAADLAAALLADLDDAEEEEHLSSREKNIFDEVAHQARDLVIRIGERAVGPALPRTSLDQNLRAVGELLDIFDDMGDIRSLGRLIQALVVRGEAGDVGEDLPDFVVRARNRARDCAVALTAARGLLRASTHDLSGADLVGLDLRNADLRDMELAGARWSNSTVWPSEFERLIRDRSDDTDIPGVYQIRGGTKPIPAGTSAPTR